MSDFDRHPDELISAYLDGEADADEAARIEGDPQSRARAAELAAVVQAVAEPVEGLTPRERDRLRARALDAAPARPAPVRDISEAARRRWRLVLIPAAAAAGIFAVALGVMSLRSGLDDDASDTAASAPATTAASSSEMAAESAAADMDYMAEPAAPEDFTEEEAATAAEAATTPDSGDEAMAESAPAPEAPAAAEAETSDQAPDAPSVADLGSFAGLEQLIDHLAARFDDAEPALDQPYAEPGPCAGVVADRVDELDAETLIEARAELATETGDSADDYRVDLAVVTTGDGGSLLIYAAEPSCEIETTALE